MGFRMRRSIKIAPGVRLNVSSKSIGVSAGVRGARVSVNSSGRRTTTVGVPGTGISYSKSTRTGGREQGTPRQASSRQSTKPAAPPAPKPTKPGLTAPKWEKVLYKQINGVPTSQRLHELLTESPEASPTITLIELLYIALPAADALRVRSLLNWMHDIAYDPAEDTFVQRYISAQTLTVPIAVGITATLPLNRDALSLFLAEVEQAEGNLGRAIEVVEVSTQTTVAAVSLAELYASIARWDDIVELTNGLTNEDDSAAFLLVQRGKALRELGYQEAARESLREALRARSRASAIRNLAYIERGITYLTEGKKGMARKDFERVLADDAMYPGLNELLDAAV